MSDRDNCKESSRHHAASRGQRPRADRECGGIGRRVTPWRDVNGQAVRVMHANTCARGAGKEIGVSRRQTALERAHAVAFSAAMETEGLKPSGSPPWKSSPGAFPIRAHMAGRVGKRQPKTSRSRRSPCRPVSAECDTVARLTIRGDSGQWPSEACTVRGKSQPRKMNHEVSASAGACSDTGLCIKDLVREGAPPAPKGYRGHACAEQHQSSWTR